MVLWLELILEKRASTILSLRDLARRAEFGQSNTRLLSLVLTFARLYDDRIDLDSTYPAIRPSGRDRDEETGPTLNNANEDWEIKHAPPGSELARSYCQCRFDDNLADQTLLRRSYE